MVTPRMLMFWPSRLVVAPKITVFLIVAGLNVNTLGSISWMVWVLSTFVEGKKIMNIDLNSVLMILVGKL